jgi:hypothetical protein
VTTIDIPKRKMKAVHTYAYGQNIGKILVVGNVISN